MSLENNIREVTGDCVTGRHGTQLSDNTYNSSTWKKIWLQSLYITDSINYWLFPRNSCYRLPTAKLENNTFDVGAARRGRTTVEHLSQGISQIFSRILQTTVPATQCKHVLNEVCLKWYILGFRRIVICMHICAHANYEICIKYPTEHISKPIMTNKVLSHCMFPSLFNRHQLTNKWYRNTEKY